MYNFLFDRKSLVLLLVGLGLGGGMLFFAGVLVGVYWSLPNGTTLQASVPARPASLAASPAREIAPAMAPPPAAPEPSPVAMSPEPGPAGSSIATALAEAEGTAAAPANDSAPVSTEPRIELPTGPAPEEVPGSVAGAGESIGLPKTAAPAPPVAAAPPPLATAKPHPARRLREPRREAGEPLFSPTADGSGIPAVAPGEGRYTLQVGAYAQVENSEEAVAALARRGYAPYVVEIHGARGLLHVVRVGRFPDRGTASRAASELRRKARMEAIVQPVLKEARSVRSVGEASESTEKPSTSG
jgi:DedD protein